MIRRLGYDCYAAYSGGDMWGGRMLGLCETRSEAESLVEWHFFGESVRGNARTTLSSGRIRESGRLIHPPDSPQHPDQPGSEAS